MSRDFSWSLGLCALFLSPAAGAQVLKCTDAEGSVTYSDVPCLRSEKTTVVDTRAASNVMDHSSIRAQQGRLAAPVAAPPASHSSPPTPSAQPTESTAMSQTQTRRRYSRY